MYCSTRPYEVSHRLSHHHLRHHDHHHYEHHRHHHGHDHLGLPEDDIVPPGLIRFAKESVEKLVVDRPDNLGFALNKVRTKTNESAKNQ